MALIFQYGSNCSESEINGNSRLCGEARFVGIAQTVEDYQLAFDVMSKNRGCAAADIVSRAGSTVWGVLYEVPDYLIERKAAKAHNRKSLDQIEGEGTNYRRRLIEVRLLDGQQRDACTYVAMNPRPGLLTGIDYVRYIVEGLREHGVAEEYVATVKVIASTNNPAIAAQVSRL